MIAEDGPSEETGDLAALFAEANTLPADDPLHGDVSGSAKATQTFGASAVPSSGKAASIFAALPQKIMQAFREHGGSSLMPEEATVQPMPKPQPSTTVRADGAVVIDASRKVSVPVFDGNGLRVVIEKAAVAGLRVQPVGSGLAREQVPAAGTMVPAGTEVVVRFGR